jgi:choline dehydrogenase-like flavoprotein
MTLIKVAPPLPQEVDLTTTYDAVTVGSGAAGGMAAHVLTDLGCKVLLLEAGRKFGITEINASALVQGRAPISLRNVVRARNR